MIEDILDLYFPNPKIPLYYTNNFTLLIAVLLSAQTTDIKVNKVTKTLFSIANTPQKMIDLGEEELKEILGKKAEIIKKIIDEEY